MSTARIKIAGIYKIESPTGKVYIGQSYDIKNRWSIHKCMSGKLNGIVYRSIRKYGWDAHTLSIVHHLPSDVDKVTITRYEQLYIDQYKECGIEPLNTAPVAGSCKGRIASDETRKKMSEALKGKKPLVFTDEIRKKISDALKGNKHTLGRKYSPEECRKISERQLGKPGKIPNGETRKKMSLARKGKKIGPMSEAHRLAVSMALKGTRASVGRILSQETKDKISNSLKQRNTLQKL